MMRRILGWVFLFALLALPLAGQAQSSGSPHVDAALADLSTRLNRPLTINDVAQWTYAENRYPDSSLGCPVAPGAPYTPGSYSAYDINLTVGGVTYNYRVSSDLTVVFPCDAALLSGQIPPTPIATTGAATFTPVPQPTISGVDGCPTGYAGYLPPRLSVGGQAAIPTGSAPNRLRDNPSLSATQIGTISSGQTVTVVGGPICADGFVWWQVTVGTQTGWTVEGALPDDYYLQPVGAQPTARATAAATATPIPATVTPGLMADIAGQQAGVFAQFSLNDGSQASVISLAVLDGAAVLYSAFTPDGDRVAAIVYATDETTGASRASLMLADTAGNWTTLAEDVYLPMPFTYSLEGDAIIYAAVNAAEPFAASSDGPGIQNLIVYQQALDASGEADAIGQIGHGVGCGGGSPYPGDAVYNLEAGYGGRPLALAMTPYGLVYSTNCTGSGTAILNLETGESTVINDRLSRVDVSPDGERLVGIADDSQAPGGGALTVVTLETLDEQTIATDQPAVLAAFAEDGSDLIYYATRTDDTGIDVSGSQALSDMMGGQPISRYTVGISAVNVDGESASIYEGDAYAIGQLLPATDGSLFFSLIPNGDAWVKAVVDGNATLDQPYDELLSTYFAVQLLNLPAEAASSDAATVVIDGVTRATVNLAALAAAG